MLSAGRSSRISIVAIIQSVAQSEQNYGREGAKIIKENCQLTIYGGFAPGSDLAQTLSKSLGDVTVQVGPISKGRGDGSRTLQMTGRPLISADELRALPKGKFIVTKTGCRPMLSTLRLFTEWGITFADEWTMPENEPRPVAYADRVALERAIERKYPRQSMLVPCGEDGFEDEGEDYGEGRKSNFPRSQLRALLKGGGGHSDKA